MRAVKYLIAPWAGVIIYVMLSLNFGALGLPSYRRLLKDKERAEENLEKLKVINQELENSKNALLYDRDTLGVYARELGFAREDEKFLRIVGLESPYQYRSVPGEVVTASQPEYLPDFHIRIIACCAAGAVLLVFAFIDILSFLKNGG